MRGEFAERKMTNGESGNFVKAVDLGNYHLVRQHLPVLVILSAAKDLGVGCWLQRHRCGEQKASSFAALRMTVLGGSSFAALRMTTSECSSFLGHRITNWWGSYLGAFRIQQVRLHY